MDNRPRLLICDDEPLMAESIKAVLDNGSYRVQTTNDSRHALTLIHSDCPDLVILDVMMPGMTGFEVLDAVDRKRCNSAFIIVTGEASVDSAIKAIRKGASDYLRKPFEPDELIVRVENVLQQRKMKQDHTVRRSRKPPVGKSAAPVPEDGSHRHPGWRYRPRLQQCIEHHPGQHRTGHGRYTQTIMQPTTTWNGFSPLACGPGK